MKNNASSQSGHSFVVGPLHGCLTYSYQHWVESTQIHTTVYQVTQAGRNRVKNAFIYVVQNVDLNKNESNTKMPFEMLQIKHGLAPWGG